MSKEKSYCPKCNAITQFDVYSECSTPGNMRIPGSSASQGYGGYSLNHCDECNIFCESKSFDSSQPGICTNYFNFKYDSFIIRINFINNIEIGNIDFVMLNTITTLKFNIEQVYEIFPEFDWLNPNLEEMINKIEMLDVFK